MTTIASNIEVRGRMAQVRIPASPRPAPMCDVMQLLRVASLTHDVAVRAYLQCLGIEITIFRIGNIEKARVSIEIGGKRFSVGRDPVNDAMWFIRRSEHQTFESFLDLDVDLPASRSRRLLKMMGDSFRANRPSTRRATPPRGYGRERPVPDDNSADSWRKALAHGGSELGFQVAQVGRGSWEVAGYVADLVAALAEPATIIALCGVAARLIPAVKEWYLAPADKAKTLQQAALIREQASMTAVVREAMQREFTAQNSTFPQSMEHERLLDARKSAVRSVPDDAADRLVTSMIDGLGSVIGDVAEHVTEGIEWSEVDE